MLSQIDDSVGGTSLYEHDLLGTLTKASYGDGSQELRLPDAVGNLFESGAKTDRQYGPGGQLLESQHGRYQYDAEGNLTEKTTKKGEAWHYEWAGNGMLNSVLRPDGQCVTFQYDALGRRVSKTYKGKTTQWVWEGNKPLHEWAELSLDGQNTEQVITWLFEEDSFAPIGKLQGSVRHSILTDHLGTPLEMIDQGGRTQWSAQTTAYGRARMEQGTRAECPFRFQGQYEDTETGLYYNRFRYYDPQEGTYISQDPIGIFGGCQFYGYVSDTSKYIDIFGLSAKDIIHRIGGNALENLRLKPAEAKLNPPGISVLSGGSPQDAAKQVRDVFADPKYTKMQEATKTVATSTVEKIKSSGFDVMPDPTKNFPNHHRLIHPDGAEGFSDENLKKLQTVFENSPCPS